MKSAAAFAPAVVRLRRAAGLASTLGVSAGATRRRFAPRVKIKYNSTPWNTSWVWWVKVTATGDCTWYERDIMDAGVKSS
ncbi:MAG: hypothetical protein AB1742_12680 [bacterium]